ncbi:MAG: DJ-1/PfpI family protein [Gammaproteobacteria bacterium]|jgi:transcriptional regulator GlxA family with amidase domain|nr:DJ-1/PfpI family protein [Gammaproteobacteria bacterium]MBU0772703.1 DJ-1/PfpI family protein [Gammaproteobacteria bacterium]MBU0857965.1 DJ-1/PfpI family protein [Gammaproteobacteria bacterium]MBU1846738.1 DJ-1/PfpI family protein [Gammaproteobacteria bacterium]
MTQNPEIETATPRLVVFLAYDGVGLLDLTGPQTVFWAASRTLEERGLPGYVRETASIAGGTVRTAEGLSLETVSLAVLAGSDAARGGIDTVVVPGAPAIEEALARSAALVEWLRGAATRARRTVSVCSGTFLLAQAGLLDGKRAATHWAMCDRLTARFPSVEVDRDAIFVRQDAVWTSAGVSAGIDLALALVESDCGRNVAMQVARELVVFLKRPGGQSQFSELLQSQSRDGHAFDALHLWINDNLGREDLSVMVLAEQARMSPRNFARVYKLKTGRTPAKTVEIMRLEAARRLLEDSSRNIDQIARQCGFGDEERMRVTFQRNLSVSPRDYRKRFSA